MGQIFLRFILEYLYRRTLAHDVLLKGAETHVGIQTRWSFPIKRPFSLPAILVFIHYVTQEKYALTKYIQIFML